MATLRRFLLCALAVVLTAFFGFILGRWSVPLPTTTERIERDTIIVREVVPSSVRPSRTEIADLPRIVWATEYLRDTTYLHDTVRTVQVQHDSTYVDRWRTQYVKGDTIYITDEVTKIVTKIVRDTAYKYVEKPVTISKTETVEVEKTLRWWQKGLMWIGVVGLMGLMGLMG